jgi:hypothetical protein
MFIVPYQGPKAVRRRLTPTACLVQITEWTLIRDRIQRHIIFTKGGGRRGSNLPTLVNTFGVPLERRLQRRSYGSCAFDFAKRNSNGTVGSPTPLKLNAITYSFIKA